MCKKSAQNEKCIKNNEYLFVYLGGQFDTVWHCKILIFYGGQWPPIPIFFKMCLEGHNFNLLSQFLELNAASTKYGVWKCRIAPLSLTYTYITCFMIM